MAGKEDMGLHEKESTAERGDEKVGGEGGGGVCMGNCDPKALAMLNGDGVCWIDGWAS